MEIRSVPPARLFHVTNAGAGVDPDHRCGHGSPSVVLHLFSDHDGTPEDLGVLLPACAAPGLFGAAIAAVAASGGPAAAQGFISKMFSAYEEAGRAIAERVRACCEAGFRTAGREHTCGRAPASPSA